MNILSTIKDYKKITPEAHAHKSKQIVHKTLFQKNPSEKKGW
jgi:hypothetical protein